MTRASVLVGIVLAAMQWGCSAEESSAPTSCAAIKAADPGATSGVHSLDLDGDGGSPAFQAYCDMTVIDEGWTLAMRIDSNAVLSYDSSHWTNEGAFNEHIAGSLEPALDDMPPVNAKFTAFDKVRGNKLRACNSQGQCLVQEFAPASAPLTLLELFKGGFVQGLADRATVNSFFLSGIDSTQPYCNRMGINNVVSTGFARARFGLLGNNENNCESPDSAIGWGIAGYCGSSCGMGSNFVNNDWSCSLPTHSRCERGTIWVGAPTGVAPERLP